MVLERSAIAGEPYESLRKGDNKAMSQNLRVQLSRQWEFVHRHALGADLESTIETLRNDGAFRYSTVFSKMLVIEECYMHIMVQIQSNKL
jgi:hypothetical protein